MAQVSEPGLVGLECEPEPPLEIHGNYPKSLYITGQYSSCLVTNNPPPQPDQARLGIILYTLTLPITYETTRSIQSSWCIYIYIYIEHSSILATSSRVTFHFAQRDLYIYTTVYVHTYTILVYYTTLYYTIPE